MSSVSPEKSMYDHVPAGVFLELGGGHHPVEEGALPLVVVVLVVAAALLAPVVYGDVLVLARVGEVEVLVADELGEEVGGLRAYYYASARDDGCCVECAEPVHVAWSVCVEYEPALVGGLVAGRGDAVVDLLLG